MFEKIIMQLEKEKEKAHKNKITGEVSNHLAVYVCFNFVGFGLAQQTSALFIKN